MAVLISTDGLPVKLDTRMWSFDETVTPIAPNAYIGSEWCDPINIFRTQRSVRTVVGFLARNIAQVALHAFRLQADGDRERLPASRTLSRLLASPSTTTTAFERMRQLVIDVCLYDRYAERITVENGMIQLHRLPPWLWEFQRDPLGRPLGICTWDEHGRMIEIGLDECLWMDGFPWECEASPILALIDLLSEERESSKYRRELWENGARMPGWIKRPLEAPPWATPRAPGEPSARDRFRDGWQQYASGGLRAGRTPILEDGMEYHELQGGITPENAQQLEARKLSIAEVASAYYVPPFVAGILEGSNYSNVKEFREILYSDTLGPWFMEIQQAHNARLLTHPIIAGDDAEFVEFNVGEKLRLAFEEQAKILQTMTGAPIMVRNEARKLLNLPRLDDQGADELVVPLNVLIGGQASPTDSAPDGEAATGGGGVSGGSSSSAGRSLSVAEVIQKVYLGVGKVITPDEARRIINAAGADLEVPGPEFGPPAPPAP